VSDTREARPLAVLDIDGVLADVRHRLHHIGTHPKDWEAFFTQAAHDPVLHDGLELARELAVSYEVLYLTGRPERSRAITQAWLATHHLPAGILLMRPDSDHRPARMFKRESMRLLTGDRTVAVVVDDDPEVIEVLRRDGVTTRLADWLPYSDPMRAGQEKDGHT
jgi:phosphoglycolate phosphatase-like HAD superfamily hydrolase